MAPGAIMWKQTWHKDRRKEGVGSIRKGEDAGNVCYDGDNECLRGKLRQIRKLYSDGLPAFIVNPTQATTLR